MYQCKRNRDNNHDVLDLRRLHIARRQAGLARGLSGAISRGELHIDYQPIVESSDGRVAAVEALLRWTHPSHGPISPAVFIPFAEQSGQIVEIGRWVIEQACADRQHWQQHTQADIAIAINVSVHQFMAIGMAQAVTSALSDTSTDPSLLTLEVTESVFVRDQRRALVVLDDLKQIGVKLALDDFGTGYSSLGYLNAMPIDAIKVDRSFVSKLTDDASSHEIVAAIIGLAHGLGMTVVAEGVETAEQRRAVTKLGCEFCQGFYFAKPMSTTLLEDLIRTRADGNGARPPLSLPLKAPRREVTRAETV
jgi:EAL domain-containing protein (putative c-di-GMP-specific phosphodiesterase class I)